MLCVHYDEECTVQQICFFISYETIPNYACTDNPNTKHEADRTISIKPILTLTNVVLSCREAIILSPVQTRKLQNFNQLNYHQTRRLAGVGGGYRTLLYVLRVL